MTTRHVSAQNDYPFYPVPDALKPVAKGILDVYFVIQGDETGNIPHDSSSDSSSHQGELPDSRVQRVYLRRYEDLGATTRYIFRAVHGDRYWDVTFTVPNTGGDLGQVSNDDGSACRAVLIYNSDFIMHATADITLMVEPGRAQFHTEQVDTLGFYNIWRCAGAEDSESSIEVLTLGSSGEDMSLNMIDGHNTVLTYESSLEIIGGVGLGKGITPDAGNTAPECQSSSEEEINLEDVVTTINGLVPENGDIPIQVIGSIGLQRSVGRLELLIRNQ